MSGKGSGKKRNRAAQSEQHGFQQSPSEKSASADTDKKSGTGKKKGSDRKRVLKKLKELDRQRHDEEDEKPKK
jgi:hypothetical protein